MADLPGKARVVIIGGGVVGCSVAFHLTKLGWQDVVAIGHLCKTGTLDTSRVVAIGGPGVQSPRLLKTRLGACLSELLKGELTPDMEIRVISGSVFGGRAVDDPAWDYLGRYDNQVSCVGEGSSVGWHRDSRNFQPFGPSLHGGSDWAKRHFRSRPRRTGLIARWSRSACLSG